MENIKFLSPKILRAIRSLWVLLLILAGLDFCSNYFYPDDEYSFTAKVLGILGSALTVVFFLWYFLVNRLWKSVAIVLIPLVLLFVFSGELRDIADYYLLFEKFLDSDTLRQIVYLVLQILAVYVLTKRYIIEENIVGKWSFAKVFLLNLGLISLYFADMGLVENILSSASFSSNTMDFVITFVYYAIVSIRSVAILGGFYFLMNCVAAQERFYTFSERALEFANRNFWPAVLISVSCMIFSFGFLMKSAMAMTIEFFGFKMSIFEWMETLSAVSLYVISARFIGQFLRYRMAAHKKYYGVAGASVWLPVLNFIPILLIKFDKKLGFLSPKNLENARKIHLTIASAFILFFYKNDILESETRTKGLLLATILIAAVWTVGYLRKFNWLLPACVAGLVALVRIYTGFGGVFMDFIKHIFSVAAIVSTVVYYGILYLVYKTVNTQE